MKLAGSNRQGRKLSADAYARLSGAKPFTREQNRDINRAALAVIPRNDEFDESGSEFFAQDKSGIAALPENEIAFLDGLIEARGLANILKAVESLIESRIEEGMQAGGIVLLHLSRDDKWARAAERLRGLAFHPDIAEL